MERSPRGGRGGGRAVPPEWRPAALAAAIVTGLIAGGIIWFAQAQISGSTSSPPKGVVGFVGGCKPFSVHAQNRYTPAGTVVRAAPSRSAAEVGGYAPNELVPINGWVRTQAAYPSNSPPFDSDAWVHVADNSGWVSFAGVRADPTVLDPTGFDPDGGRPVPLDPTCSGSIR